jgi:2',3'-cyclic-nucleotide 2'-phosphodiesterase (5'-nucleotidase family)
VVASERIARLIEQARAEVAPIAGRSLGTAAAQIRIDRTKESPLADALTDGLRGVSGADVAFLNTGGIRAPIDAGDVTYEDFYRVIPFNNHGLIVGPMPAEKLLALLDRSIKTCGAFGALMQSGLKVSFERDCSRESGTQLDSKARLLRVETQSGEVIFDAASGVEPASGRTFTVATLDFLAAGGSGFDGFRGTPLIRDMGIVREAMVEFYLSNPMSLSAVVDGRWKEQLPAH